VGTQAKEQVTLLTDYAADSAYSKAYYTLFANIRFNWDNEQGHNIQFCLRLRHITQSKQPLLRTWQLQPHSAECQRS